MMAARIDRHLPARCRVRRVRAAAPARRAARTSSSRRTASHGLRAVRPAGHPRGLAARDRGATAVSLPPVRPRRGRSLFDRLRQVGKPAPERGRRHAVGEARRGAVRLPRRTRGAARRRRCRRGSAAPTGAAGGPCPRGAAATASAPPTPAGELADAAPARSRAPPMDDWVERAIAVFNAGEHPPPRGRRRALARRARA